MAIAPNTTFVSGAILTAAQQNAFGFGICQLATSSTDYTLTTSAALATGMSASFTAIANRNYKVTYYEGQVQTANVLNASSRTQIRLTNAAGTLLNQTICQTVAAQQSNQTLICMYVGTFTAGVVVVVGCALANSTSGAPVLGRSGQPAYLLVEDIGPA